jgi:AP-2 complex subunit sigma-1
MLDVVCLSADSLPAAAEPTGEDQAGSGRQTTDSGSTRLRSIRSHSLPGTLALAVSAAKYYSSFEHEEKRQLEVEVHKLVTKRDPKFTNFIEVRRRCKRTELFSESPTAMLMIRLSVSPLAQFRRYKVIYRRYAGLYFSLCLDVNDNELVYLESIHLFVELLDKFFASVCELDLVFNFHKIYSILDELYLGGEVQETSKRVILERLEELNKLE